MPLDNEGYTCVQVFYGTRSRFSMWRIVDRYGAPVAGEVEYRLHHAARARAEAMNAAVLAARFTDG